MYRLFGRTGFFLAGGQDVPNQQQITQRERPTGNLAPGHGLHEPGVGLGGEVAHPGRPFDGAFDLRLFVAGDKQGHGHNDRAAPEQKDRPFPLPSANKIAAHPDVTAPFLNRHEEESGKEGQVAVRGAPLRAVGVQVDMRGVCMKPQTPAPKKLPTAWPMFQARAGGCCSSFCGGRNRTPRVPPRIEQNWRVSLLEESAVIARELHDSLAQSLAYMKIQVSRPSKPAEKAGKTAGSRTGAA